MTLKRIQLTERSLAAPVFYFALRDAGFGLLPPVELRSLHFPRMTINTLRAGNQAAGEFRQPPSANPITFPCGNASPVM